MLLWTSCKKETPLEDVSYKCECGSLSLEGQSTVELTDAHWIELSRDTNEFGFEVTSGKEYYATAKIETEGEPEPHHMHLRLTIPDVFEGPQLTANGPRFFWAHPDSNSVSIDLRDVNLNNLNTTTRYVLVTGEITTGAYELTENLDTETDILSVNIAVAPSLNGITPIGFPLEFSADITATKEEFE